MPLPRHLFHNYLTVNAHFLISLFVSFLAPLFSFSLPSFSMSQFLSHPSFLPLFSFLSSSFSVSTVILIFLKFYFLPRLWPWRFPLTLLSYGLCDQQTSQISSQSSHKQVCKCTHAGICGVGCCVVLWWWNVMLCSGKDLPCSFSLLLLPCHWIFNFATCHFIRIDGTFWSVLLTINKFRYRYFLSCWFFCSFYHLFLSFLLLRLFLFLIQYVFSFSSFFFS